MQYTPKAYGITRIKSTTCYVEKGGSNVKQAYQKPNFEWIDFDHKERIAASGSSCEARWCQAGWNGSCEKPIYTFNNIVS